MRLVEQRGVPRDGRGPGWRRRAGHGHPAQRASGTEGDDGNNHAKGHEDHTEPRVPKRKRCDPNESPPGHKRAAAPRERNGPERAGQSRQEGKTERDRKRQWYHKTLSQSRHKTKHLIKETALSALSVPRAGSGYGKRALSAVRCNSLRLRSLGGSLRGGTPGSPFLHAPLGVQIRAKNRLKFRCGF